MQTNELTPFAFGDDLVRVVRDENGEPWFVAKDVCLILEIQNSRDAVSALDEDEKADVGISDTSSNGVTQTRNFSIISESGLYALIFRSRKPEAKAFSKWVRSEVLPAIRKTGRYQAPGRPDTGLSERVRRLLGDFYMYGSKFKASVQSLARELEISDGEALAAIFDLYAATFLGDVKLAKAPLPEGALRKLKQDFDGYILNGGARLNSYQQARLFADMCDKVAAILENARMSCSESFESHVRALMGK